MWDKVEAAARWLEGDASEASPAAVARGSRALCAALLLALAIPLSALTRHLGAPSMVAALGLAVLGAGFAAFALWPLLGWRRRPVAIWAPFIGLTIVAVVLILSQLWASAFDGLPAMTGGDGGLHLTRQSAFVRLGRNDYQGMATLLATTHWLSSLGGLDSVAAYRTAFRLIAALVAILATTAAALATTTNPNPNPNPNPSTSARQRALILLLALAAAIPAAHFVALPLLHYYQCDGFFPQLFGLGPVVLALLGYAAPTRRLTRLGLLCAAIILLRFTYLLNAGDLLLGAAVVLVLESYAPGLRPRARLLLRAGALVSLLAAAIILRAFLRIASDAGGFHGAALTPIPVGLALLALPLLTAAPMLAWADPAAALPPAAVRLTRLLGILALAPALVLLGWLAAGRPATYYAQKYGFSACVLVGCAGPAILLAAATRALLARRSLRVAAAGLALCVLAAGAITILTRTTRTYWPSYAERRHGGPPWRHLEPHADRAALAIMRGVLADEHARFGGFLTPSWPESQFANASFGGDIHSVVASHDGVVSEEPGACVFSYEPSTLPARPHGHWSDAVLATQARLAAHPAYRCTRYRPPHETSDVTLCHVCFRGSTRELPLFSASPAITTTGFHGLEHVDGRPARWTDGHGRISFVPPGPAGASPGASCTVHVELTWSRPFELWLDGTPLGPGGVHPLPALPQTTHTLEIISPTFVPADEPGTVSTDHRTLGVMVRRVAITCAN